MAQDVARGHALLPRVSNISREAFRRDFEARQYPVILEDMISDWPAYLTWSPDFFKETYGDVVCHASLDVPNRSGVGDMEWEKFSKWMPVAEFVDYMLASDKPCYMRQAPQRLFEQAERDFDFGRFTDLSGGNLYNNIFLGSGNTNSSLHYDLPNNFLAQIYGAKQVIMYAPEQRHHIDTYPDSLRMSPIDPYAPDPAAYPRFAAARGYVGILEAGDVLFIPRTWWHQLRSVNVSISINCWYGREASAAYFLKIAAANGLSHFLTPLRDFIVLGLFGRKYQPRLFGDAPTGLWFYGVLREGMKRKLGIGKSDGFRK